LVAIGKLGARDSSLMTIKHLNNIGIIMDYGTVSYQGKELKLLDQAEFSNKIGEEHVMFADALDAEGKEYRIIWDVIDEDCDDGIDLCDWSKYKVIEL
jgi:hypothetical protein